MGEQAAEVLHGREDRGVLKGVDTIPPLSHLLFLSLHCWQAADWLSGGDETWVHHALCGLGAFFSSSRETADALASPSEAVVLQPGNFSPLWPAAEQQLHPFASIYLSVWDVCILTSGFKRGQREWLLKTGGRHMTGLRLYVIWLQHISRSCPALVLSIIIFLPLKKRLMSPENSTRKVNTILKCQEINDIVLSSYGPVGEGDKCLALFTPFLPICDLFLPPSHSLCLCVCLSFILHLSFSPPCLCLSLVLLRWPWSPDAEELFPPLHVNAAAIRSDTTQEMGCAVHCMWLSANE